MKKALGLLALIIVALFALAAPAGAWTGDTTVTGAASCDTTLVTWTVHVHTPSNYTGSPTVLISISGLAKGTALYDGFTFQGNPPKTLFYVNYPGKNGDLSVYAITNTADVTPATCETTTTTSPPTTTTSIPKETTTSSTTTTVPDTTTTQPPSTTTLPVVTTTTATVNTSTSTTSPRRSTTMVNTAPPSQPPTSSKPPSTPSSVASPPALAFTGGNAWPIVGIAAVLIAVGILLARRQRR